MYEIQDEIQFKIKKEFKTEFKVGCDGESVGREMRFIAVMFSSKHFVCTQYCTWVHRQVLEQAFRSLN